MRKEKDIIIEDEERITDPETGRRKWRIGDIGRFLGACVKAIVQGKFIVKLKLDKYFLEVAWTFMLFGGMILFGFVVDSALSKVEDNKKELRELEILRTQKQYEIITIDRRSSVNTLLREKGSKVQEPQKPAIMIKK